MLLFFSMSTANHVHELNTDYGKMSDHALWLDQDVHDNDDCNYLLLMYACVVQESSSN